MQAAKGLLQTLHMQQKGLPQHWDLDHDIHFTLPLGGLAE